jgi:DnaJ-domain-containing protein 1
MIEGYLVLIYLLSLGGIILLCTSLILHVQEKNMAKMRERIQKENERLRQNEIRRAIQLHKKIEMQREKDAVLASAQLLGLDIEQGITKQQVSKAWRDMIKAHHPDTHKGKGYKTIQEITEARNLLNSWLSKTE